ncbi:MAG: TolC family protein [Polyangia bacterium]|jgi:cobalt-zinc-cadmium efflux system outer membrane protein
MSPGRLARTLERRASPFSACGRGLPLALAVGALLSASAARADRGLAKLTASDAIRLALSRNPDSRATDEDVAAAGGALIQSKLLSNPSIFIYTLGAGISPAEAPIPNQFGVTWTIPFGGKRAAGIAIARAGVKAAESTRVAARRQLALSVETRFVSVLLDQSILAFAEEDQAAFRQSVTLNELRYKDGKIAWVELLKLRIQERAVDDTVRQAAQALFNDRAELSRLVGVGTLDPNYAVVGELAPPPENGDFSAERVIDQALEDRADYRALAAQRDSAEAAVRLARRIPIPDVGVLADYNRTPGSAGSYDISLTAAVPIFDHNQGNLKTAIASFEKAKLALDSLRAQIRADAVRAVEEWRISRERLSSYSGALVQAAREALDINRRSYQEGRGSLLDYLSAESDNRDVQRAYRSAQAEAMLAAANLKFVSGEDLP